MKWQRIDMARMKAWLIQWHINRCAQERHVFGRWVFGNKMVCRHCSRTVRDFT